ncbi:HNH endonuclease [Rhodococcus sp. IC4_135]|nr:HNH endonuclease [Rhodococcus sp. IC4_135]
MAGWGGRAAAGLTEMTIATYGVRCHLCGKATPPATTADHIIPRSRGGADTLSNLRPAHQSCNSARGNKSMTQWWASKRGRALVAPPSRDWLQDNG